MSEIKVTKYDECLRPAHNTGGDFKDDEFLIHRTMVHDVCNGFMDVNQISETHRAITCRQCKLRLVIPNTINTFGEFKSHLLTIWEYKKI